MKHTWLYLTKSDIEVERRQCEEEGRDLTGIEEEFERVLSIDLEDLANQPAAQALLDRAAAAPMRPDYPYLEPSDLEGIWTQRPATSSQLPAVSTSELEDRIHGAWTGRCVGCLLGKPVEGWRRPRMWGYLKDTGRWPLADFFRYDVVPEAIRTKYEMHPGYPWGDKVQHMPEDDDTNYTVTGLAILKRYGPRFTPENVATFWMSDIPILHTCTAERVAYRNLVLLIPPPASASVRNPYREWIGAQIRADFWGYAAAGRPELAAEFAWRDASISHVKNGIYGEMWAAAMVAAAFTGVDPASLPAIGLEQVPANCRLAEAVQRVLSWWKEGISYDEAVERLHAEWNEDHAHDWCHTISNAMVVTIGLLWGEGDFALSICRAVQACFDTDCNGATVGSIMGACLGRKKLPPAWADHIHDTLQTGVAGYHVVTLSDLTRQTLSIIDQVGA